MTTGGSLHDDPSGARRFPHRTAAWLIFGIALSVYTATAGGSLSSTDPVVAYDLTVSIVERGSVAIEPGHAGMKRRGVDGRLYPWFGIGQSIYNIPFYLAGRTLARAVGPRFGKPDSLPKAAVAMGSAVAAAGCAALVFLFAWQLTAKPGPSVAAAFGLAFATVMWPYSKFGFNVPLAALLAVSGTYFTWLGARRNNLRSMAIGGTLLGAGLLTRHEVAVLIAPIGAWILLEARTDRRRLVAQLAALAVPVCAAAVAWAVYNQVRFGNPLDSGQVISGQASIELVRSPFTMLGRSFFSSLWALLFNSSTSVLLYWPIVLLSVPSLFRLARKDASTARLLAAQLIVHLLFLAVVGNWQAGRSYGSRFMVLTMPLLAVPLAFWCRPIRSRRSTLAACLAAISILIQLPGILVDYSKVDLKLATASEEGLPARRLASWENADLIANAREAARLVPLNLRYLTGVEPRPPVDRTAGADRHDFAQQFVFSLDFWWLYLFYLGAVPAPIALCGLLIPLAAAAFLAKRLRLLCANTGSPTRC